MPSSTNPRRVTILVYDGVTLLDVAGPAEAFQTANRFGADYQIVLVSPRGETVTSNLGFGVCVDRAVSAEPAPDTYLVPGADRYPRAPVPRDLAEAARVPAGGARRIASICTGAFILAAAGLLDGRRATTHWKFADDMRRLHPRVLIDENVLFVDDGDVLTSAGLAAGIDLCLHLIRSDHGAQVANAVARYCVVPPWREGGQAQFIDRHVPAPDHFSTATTREWALQHLDEELTVQRLARHAKMSARTFNRRFREETGQAPGMWIRQRRIDRARELLESRDLPVDEVARLSGLGTGGNLRHHLRRGMGISPSSYRKVYQGA